MNLSMLENILKDSYASNFNCEDGEGLVCRKKCDLNDGVVLLQNSYFRIILELPTVSSSFKLLEDLDLRKLYTEIEEKVTKLLVLSKINRSEQEDSVSNGQVSISVLNTAKNVDVNKLISNIVSPLQKFIGEQLVAWSEYAKSNDVCVKQEKAQTVSKDEFNTLAGKEIAWSKDNDSIKVLGKSFLKDAESITGGCPSKIQTNSVTGKEDAELDIATRFEKYVFKMNSDIPNLKEALRYTLSKAFTDVSVSENVLNTIAVELNLCSKHFINVPIELAKNTLEFIFADLYLNGVLRYKLNGNNLEKEELYTISRKLAKAFTMYEKCKSAT